MSGSKAMVKLKAGLAAATGAAGGLVYGPVAVQAAIVAVLVTTVTVVGLAHAHDMSVGRAAALYGGRLVLALAKTAALVLVQWPLRAGHRGWCRFDIALRAELAAVGVGYRLGGRAAAVVAGRSRTLRPVIAVVGPPPPAATDEHALSA
jgi:hypothetical protein